MSAFTFGLTLLIVGMGGTLLTLYVLTLLIRVVTKLLPARPEPKGGETPGAPVSHD